MTAREEKTANLNRRGRGGPVLFIIAAILLFITLIAPALRLFMMSFQDYRVQLGIWGSPWVGLMQYQKAAHSMMFGRVFRNSLVMGVLGGILPVLPGYLIGRAAAGCGSKTSWFWTGALLIPVFLPGDFLARLFVQGTGSTLNGIIVWVYYLMAAGVRTLFLTAFLSAAVGRLMGERNGRADLGAKLGAGFMLALGLIFLFSPDMGICSILGSPQNYEYSDVFSTVQYRSGLAESSYGFSGALWVLHMLFQLPGLAAGTVLILRIFKGLAPDGGKPGISAPERGKGTATVWGGLSAAFMPAVSLWMLLLYGKGGVQMQEGLLGFTVSMLLLTLFVTLFYLPAIGWSCGRGGKGLLISLCLLLPLSGNTVGQYFVFRGLGMVNTAAAPALAALSLPLALTFGLVMRAVQPEKRPLSLWLGDAVPVLALFFGLVAANSWGGEGAQRIFLSARSKFGIGLYWAEVSQLQAQSSESSVLAVALWTVLPMVLLAFLSVFIFGKLMDRRRQKGMD